MSKCKRYNHCKNAFPEARRGDFHRCPHGKLFICVRAANPYLYAMTEQIRWYKNPVVWFKVRRALR